MGPAAVHRHRQAGGGAQGGAFTFVAGVEEVVARAVEAAGDKDVHVMGGANVIRQALELGLVEELTIIIAPVILGGGKRLFEGFLCLGGPRAPRRATVAVRNVHRVPGQGEVTPRARGGV